MQLPDGSFEYLKGLGGDEFATRQVVAALLGNPHPMRIDEPELCDLDASWLPSVWSSSTGIAGQ